MGMSVPSGEARIVSLQYRRLRIYDQRPGLNLRRANVASSDSPALRQHANYARSSISILPKRIQPEAVVRVCHSRLQGKGQYNAVGFSRFVMFQAAVCNAADSCACRSSVY